MNQAELKKIDLGTPDYTAEEVRALYFDADALIEPAYRLYRLDSKGGDRYYYRFNEQGKPEFFISVTTFIHKAIPTSPHLLKWIADMGYQQAEEYKKERAAYGTFLHGATEQLTINREYDLDTLEERLREYIHQKLLPSTLFEKWYYEMKKDILSWAKFLIDYNVKPLAIEIMLCSPEMENAGAIDLVCEMDIRVKGYHGEVYASGPRKGEPKESFEIKRITAIVDTKGGKKGFYEAHELQLHTYRKMFEENYPNIKIDKVYNWSGKDWRSEPTYNLTDQTESPMQYKIPHILANAKIDAEYKDERELTIISGKIEIDQGVERNYRVVTKEELVEQKAKKP